MEKGGGERKKWWGTQKVFTFVKVATCHVLHLARRYYSNWTSNQPECTGYGHNQIVWDRTHKSVSYHIQLISNQEHVKKNKKIFKCEKTIRYMI
jgi:hypothetical protein